MRTEMLIEGKGDGPALLSTWTTDKNEEEKTKNIENQTTKVVI